MNISFNEKSLLHHTGTVTLSTERLTLRRFRINDAEEMYRNWAADKEVAKYTLWNVNLSSSETREYLIDWVSRYDNDEYYHWGIVLNENEELIGSISISSINNLLKTCNVGYTLSKKVWNMGIATEALKRVLEYMVNDIGMERIFAYHDINNTASGRVMQKCGMKFVKRKKKFFLNSKHCIVECDYYCYFA